MRHLTSSCLILLACLYTASAIAGSFPPIVDARVSNYGVIEDQTPVFIPGEGEYSFVLTPIEDFDNDGIVDHILQVFDDSLSYLDVDSLAEESPSCSPLHLVPSRTTGSSFVLSDLVEIKGLEVLFAGSDDVYSCLGGYIQPEQYISDLNNDGIDELLFYNESYNGDGSGNSFGAIIVFGKIAPGAVIDLAAAVDTEGGFTLPVDTYVLPSVGDVNGDNVDDAVFLTATFAEDFSSFSSVLRIISGALLGSVSSWSLENFDAISTLLEINTDSYALPSLSADFNGDSYSDFIITLYQLDGVTSQHLVYGAPGLMINDGLETMSPLLPDIELCNDYCGVFPIGDFNADGYDDAMVSGYGISDGDVTEGWILYGSAMGLPQSIELDTSTEINSRGMSGVDFLVDSFDSQEYVGDFNDDGASDLVLASFDGSFHAVILGQAQTSPQDIDDIQLNLLNGDNGFLILADEYSYYNSPRIADLNNDGIDDIGSLDDYNILLLGRPVSESPQGVQNLVVATAPTATFLNWNVPAPGVGALQLEILVNGTFIDTVDASEGYYAFSNPAPDSTSVISAQYVNSSREVSPAIQHPLSNNFQGLKQLRATVYSENSVELFWNEEPSQYYVWRNGTKIAEVNGNSYLDTGVRSGVNYYYHITQGPNAYGLNLGRSSTLPPIEVYGGCIDYCFDVYVYDDSDSYVPYYPSSCVYGETYDYRNSFLRSRFPASTDELLVVTDTAGTEFSTPVVESIVLDCLSSRPFQISYGYYEIYSATDLEIFWERASHDNGVVAYEVTRDGEIVASRDATSYFDNAIGNNVLYEYKVTAIAGDGSRSVPVVISVYLPENDEGYSAGIDTSVSSVELSASVYSSSAVELFWNHVYDSEGYSAQYLISRDGVELLTTDGVSFFDSSLVAGQSYAYDVFSIGRDGLASEAATILVNTPSNGSIESTSNPLPTGATGEVYSNSAVELFWDQSTDISISHYEIFLEDEKIGETNGRSFYISGLQADTHNSFSIQAVTVDGNVVGRASSVTLRTNN